MIEASFDDAPDDARAPPPLPDRDLAPSSTDGLPRILPPAARSSRGPRAAGHRDAGGLVIAADSEHARAIARLVETSRRDADGRPAPEARRAREARGVRRLARGALDRRGEHGVRGRRHPAPACRASTRPPAEDAVIFRQIVGRFVRHRRQAPPAMRVGSTCPATRSCGARHRGRRSSATSCAR